MEGNKRSRDDEQAESADSKRFRSDLLLEILDDDDAVPSTVDLDDVIKSFEEEIGVAPPQEQPDLEFLLEASDDELGLPPTAGSTASPSSDGGETVEIADGEPEGMGFGEIWGFEDRVEEGLGFQGFEEEEGFGFDGGLFNYDDVAGWGPSDLEEVGWRTETLPAV